MKLKAKTASPRRPRPHRCREVRVEGGGVCIWGEAAKQQITKFQKPLERTAAAVQSGFSVPQEPAQTTAPRPLPSLVPLAPGPRGLVVYPARHSSVGTVQTTTRPRSQRAGLRRSQPRWVCECRGPEGTGARRQDAVAGHSAWEQPRRLLTGPVRAAPRRQARCILTLGAARATKSCSVLMLQRRGVGSQ